MSVWSGRRAWPEADSPRVRARTLVLLCPPRPCYSIYGNFCGHAIPSIRLLALAWRVFSPPSSGRLWLRLAVCLPDVVYCVVDSLLPLQVVHGVQEQASRMGMVELPVDPGVCIEIWGVRFRTKKYAVSYFSAESEAMFEPAKRLGIFDEGLHARWRLQKEAAATLIAPRSEVRRLPRKGPPASPPRSSRRRP